MFTANEQIAADATDLFNYLTGYSAKRDFQKLLVSPVTLRTRFEALIAREIEHQKKRRARASDFQDECAFRCAGDRPAV